MRAHESLPTKLKCIDINNDDLGLGMRHYNQLPERSLETGEKDGLTHTERTPLETGSVPRTSGSATSPVSYNGDEQYANQAL